MIHKQIKLKFIRNGGFNLFQSGLKGCFRSGARWQQSGLHRMINKVANSKDGNSQVLTQGKQLKNQKIQFNFDIQEVFVKVGAFLEVQISAQELQERLIQILHMLPDMENKISTMKPSTLSQLLSDPNLIALRIIGLKQLFSNANISSMASRQPEILLQDTNYLYQQVQTVKNLMQMDDLSSLIEREPRFLDSEGVKEALQELERLLGDKVNIRQILFKDPSYLLKVERGQKRLGENPDAI